MAVGKRVKGSEMLKREVAERYGEGGVVSEGVREGQVVVGHDDDSMSSRSCIAFYSAMLSYLGTTLLCELLNMFVLLF